MNSLFIWGKKEEDAGWEHEKRDFKKVGTKGRLKKSCEEGTLKDVEERRSDSRQYQVEEGFVSLDPRKKRRPGRKRRGNSFDKGIASERGEDLIDTEGNQIGEFLGSESESPKRGRGTLGIEPSNKKGAEKKNILKKKEREE